MYYTSVPVPYPGFLLLQPSVSSWSFVFYFSGLLYISCGSLFLAFGSVDEQPFNTYWKTDEDEEKSKKSLWNNNNCLDAEEEGQETERLLKGAHHP